MKKQFFFIPFFLSFCCLSAAQNTTSLTEAQQLEVTNAWDFGQVKTGALLEHGFILKNNANQSMAIKKIDTSCGCTVSETKKEFLLPGEETTIEVRFNPAGYYGEIQQYVYVHTDSLEHPLIKFIIKANVIP